MIVIFQCPVCQIRSIDNAESGNEVRTCGTENCEGEAVVIDQVNPETGWWASAS